MKKSCNCGNSFKIPDKNRGGRKLCDECRKKNQKAYSKNWYDNNKEYHKEYLKNWRAKCKEEERVLMCKFIRNNFEVITESNQSLNVVK